MTYTPKQVKRAERYPGEMIVPDLLNRIGSFLAGQGADFMRGLSNAPNPYANQKILGVPLFEGHTVTGKALDQSIQDLGPVRPAPESAEPVAPAAAPRVFDNTLEGQYQRYFQTPEMDYVFGAGARGKDAPKDAAAMELLGNQLQAPAKDTNIASMYAAQSAMGRVNQDAIQDYFSDPNLPGNVKKEGAKLSALQQWAKENPMLAQREYLKAEQRRAADIGNERERVQMDNPMGKEAYDLIKKQLLNKAAGK